MAINQSNLVRQARLFESLNKHWDSLKMPLVNCYNQLAEAYVGSIGTGVVSNNTETYSVLLNRDLIYFVTYQYVNGKLDDIKDKYSRIDGLFDTSSDYYITRLIPNTGITPVANLADVMDISNAMSTFGIPTVSDNDTFEIGFDGNDDELMKELGGANIFDENFEPQIEISDDDFEVDGDEEIDEGETEIYLDDENDDQGSKPSTDQPVSQNTPIQNQQSDSDEVVQEDPNRQKLIDDLRNSWGSKLNRVVNDILASYKILYESGYGLIPPAGILTNQGIYRANSRGEIGIAGDRATDIEVYNVITKLTGKQYVYFAGIGEEVSIQKLMQMNEPLTFIEFHLRCMFGYLNFCKGEHSIRKYLTAHNIKNDSTSKVLKYSDMKGYIKEELEKVFYNSYIDAGVTADISPENTELVNNVNVKLSMSLKNVIVVAERKDNVNTRLRICSDKPLNEQELIRSLTRGLNIGTSSGVEVKAMGAPKSGVYDINIIYNSRAFSQDSLFAYQVLDILQEQDIRPAWDKVILGKKDDGNIMTYNFKDANNSSIALYGGKGSGKGVMTLNLISSALADGCALMYMDAKPDTAIPLVKVAWGAGLDACIYNGKENPGASLEIQGNNPRTVDRFMSKDYIPEGIFKTEAKKEQFILLTTYYRGLELFLDLAEARAANVINNIHNERWLVAIFDEVQQLATTEKTVVTELAAIKKSREKHKEEVDGKIKSINYYNDPIWKFIDEYDRWRAILKDRMATALGSTFRKAEVTSIWIWQTTEFPYQYKAESIVAAAINQEAPAMVKIIGRAAAASSGGSVVFGTDSDLRNKTTWFDERFTGKNGGYWAIGNRVNSDDAMTIFRPFNVYSNANDKKLLVMNAEAAGLTEQDLYDISLNRDGTVKPEIGFEGYVNKLLAPYGINAAQQLNIGYQYADEWVRKSGKADSLPEFMYNAHKFILSGDSESEDEEEGIHIEPTEGSEMPMGFNPPSGGNVQNPVNMDTNGQPAGRQPVSDDSRIFDEDDLKRYGILNQNMGQNPNSTDNPDDLDEEPLDFGFEDDTFDGANFGTGGTGQTSDDQPYQNPQASVNNGADDLDDIEVEPGYARSPNGNTVNAAAEILNTRNASAYRMGDAKDGFMTFITPSKTSKLLNLTAENSCVVAISDFRSPRSSSRFLKSLRGARYEMDSRWKCILEAIAKTQNPNTITTVTICNDVLVFNRKQVAALGLIGGPDGIEVKDIVNFSMLNKMFRNIRKLTIDMDVYESSTAELGYSPEIALFNTLHNLQVLEIYRTGYGEKPDRYTRQSIETEEARRNIDLQNRRTELKHGIDTIAAANNPNISRLDPINRYRLDKKCVNLSRGGWESCKKNFSQDHWARGTLSFVWAASTLAASVPLKVVGGLFNKFSK